MTDEEQFAVINTRQWYTDMRTQTSTIIKAMQDNHFNISGTDASLITEVSGVLVSFQLVGSGEVHARVAKQSDGTWMYDWKFPIGWVAPDAPAPVASKE